MRKSVSTIRVVSVRIVADTYSAPFWRRLFPRNHFPLHKSLLFIRPRNKKMAICQKCRKQVLRSRFGWCYLPGDSLLTKRILADGKLTPWKQTPRKLPLNGLVPQGSGLKFQTYQSLLLLFNSSKEVAHRTTCHDDTSGTSMFSPPWWVLVPNHKSTLQDKHALNL